MSPPSSALPDTGGLNVARHAAHWLGELLSPKLSFWTPDGVEATSSSAEVPFDPVNWVRSVAPVPAVTVIGELNMPMPANASSPAGTDAVLPVVAVVLVPVLHEVPSSGLLVATPEYSAIPARMLLLLEAVTVTVVLPAFAFARYQSELRPSEAPMALVHAPLSESETDVVPEARNIPTSRSPAPTLKP